MIMSELQVSSEKKMTIFLLCYIFGIFGLHRFLTGKPITGLIMLLTLGGACVWWLVDMVLIISGHFTDKEGKPIIDWV
jgi:TM2 domain-containing membrane protein YozV